LLLTVSWDFLWFLWNPSFGLTRFRADNIWWYSRWVLGIPIDYYVGLGLSFLVYLAGAHSRERIGTQTKEWIGTVGTLAVLTVATIVLITWL